MADEEVVPSAGRGGLTISKSGVIYRVSHHILRRHQHIVGCIVDGGCVDIAKGHKVSDIPQSMRSMILRTPDRLRGIPCRIEVM